MKYIIILLVCVVFTLQYLHAETNNYDKIQTKLKQNPVAQKLLNELQKADIKKHKSVKYLLDTNEQYVLQPIDFSKDKTVTKLQGFVDLEKQWYLQACNIVNAWKKSRGKNVIIAVIDTGIDYDNNDLKEQLWINGVEDLNQNGTFNNWITTETRNGISGDLDGIDNDGNGFVDDVLGYDFVDEMITEDSSYNGDRQNIDCDPKGEHKHGTEVASVVSSVATDAKIMAIRVHNDRGQSDCYAIAQAIVYAVLNGANVINLSSGEYDNSPLFHSAIKFAEAMNVVVVASAGNDHTTSPHYPSDYKEVISVGGVNENLEQIFNYGDFLDITAPSVNIYVTSKDNLYFSVSGTSFSAPIVSGVCALLISYYKEILHEEITPIEVKTILSLTANSATGWSPQFGGGIVNAKRCLDFIEKAKFEITQPLQYSALNINANDTLTVSGTILLPLLDSYTIRMRSCREPGTYAWDTLIQPQNRQIMDADLYKISLQDLMQNHPNLKLGENILSVICNLKSGKTFEERISVTLYDNNSLKIAKISHFRPYFNDKKIIVVNAKTTLPCSLRLYYKTAAEESYQIVNSNDYITRNHILYLQNLDITQNYHCYLTAELGGMVDTSEPFEITGVATPYIFNGRLKKQNYTIPAGNLYKNSFVINGKSAVLSSAYLPNIAPSVPTKLNLYVIKNDSAIAIDSSNSNAICHAVGDIDKNGKIDFLCGYYGVLDILTQNNNSLFDNTIATIKYHSDDKPDSSASRLAVGLSDIDNDGEIEILYRDNEGNFWVRKQTENNYTETQFNFYELLGETSFANNFFSASVGQYYGNGKNYLAILSTNHSYIAIIECQNGQFFVKETKPLQNHFHNRLAHNSHSINAIMYSTNADIDADGTDELMYLFFGKIDDTTGIENEQTAHNLLDTSDVLGKYEMWTLYIYKNINDNLENIGHEDLLGVKIDLATSLFDKRDNYRNSLTSGDIDNDGAAEILVGAFPNLYVFKWDASTKQTVPLWFYPEANSNTATVGDFNTNGKNEICFNDFNKTVFFEYDSIAPTIHYFNGFAKDASSLYFNWKYSESTLPVGTKYELWLIETAELENISLNPDKWNADIIAKFKTYQTAETHIEINELQYKTEWTAFVRIKNESSYFDATQFSNPITVWTNDLTFPITVFAINKKFVKIKFNQQLNINNSVVGICLKNSSNTRHNIVNFTAGKDSTLLVEVADELVNADYEIQIPVLTDCYCNPTVADTLSFSVNFEDTMKLYLVALKYTPPHSLILTFSEAIDKMRSPFNVQNYTLLPLGEIEKIDLLDSITVQLSLSEQYALEGRGKDYTLTAKPTITANSGNTMTTGAGNTLSFVFFEPSLSDPYIYPAPVSLSKHTEAYFGHLTQVADIKILNSFGATIRKINATTGNGGIEWDLKDASGNICNIGIYFAIIKDTMREKEIIIKFAIVE